MATGRGRSRRVSLPGVAELLRPATRGPVDPDEGDQRRASGRERHTQKITVYLSAEELLDLERARLALLRYGAAADRGRIVREAIAVLLADLDARGRDSLLARRIVRAGGEDGGTPIGQDQEQLPGPTESAM
ncbi:MAG TPA: cobyrinic acid a,c-diamide synthase [Streptosporangiaceae bacterium]|nr:cobyrinic acid a,c-diamide synthase [Streptosporangiaceae bacterium]